MKLVYALCLVALSTSACRPKSDTISEVYSSRERMKTTEQIVKRNQLEIAYIETTRGGREAYRLTVREIMLGGNRCEADGAVAKIKTRKEASDLIAVAVLEKPIRPNQRCPQSIDPVYSGPISIDLSVDVNGGIVKMANYEQMGNSVALDKILKSPLEHPSLEVYDCRVTDGTMNTDIFRIEANITAKQTKLFGRKSSQNTTELNLLSADVDLEKSPERADPATGKPMIELIASGSETPNFEVGQCYADVVLYRIVVSGEKRGLLFGDVSLYQAKMVNPRAICPHKPPTPTLRQKASLVCVLGK